MTQSFGNRLEIECVHVAQTIDKRLTIQTMKTIELVEESRNQMVLSAHIRSQSVSQFFSTRVSANKRVQLISVHVPV